MRVLFQTLVLGLLLCPPAFAADDDPAAKKSTEQNPSVTAPGHSLHGEAFDEGPRQKAYLKPGQGKIDFKITTDQPKCQEFMNQGVAQLHSFYYLEAERSFRQASLEDPKSPMPFWGMAMANVNNAKRARGFVAEMTKLSGDSLSPREKLYLSAMTALYRDNGKHDPAFLSGMEAIVQEFPDDLDARVWLAMLIWQNGNVGASRQAVDGLLEYVEKVEPMHPGVHHYRIHLWDGTKPIRAVNSAATYARTALGIAHAWHMPGHTYTGLKRYAEAAYQQEGSARVDHAAMAKDRIMPFEIHNYAHNNQWLATSLSHIGRYKHALAVAKNLVEQPRDPQKNTKGDAGSSQRSGRARWSEILTRYELWDELIAAANSGQLDWSDQTEEKRERAYCLGLAYAAKGDTAQLEAQIQALRQVPANKRAPNAPAEKAGAAPAATPTGPELSELEGHLKLIDKDVQGALDSFAKASRMRGESLARAQVALRNFGLAPGIAKKAVDDNPNQVVPLAACVEVLQLCGNPVEAQQYYSRLEPYLASADRDAPVFQRLEAIVQGWKADQWKPADRPASESSSADQSIDLTTLGPLGWGPYQADAIDLPGSEGKPWKLSDHKGRNVLVLFYLGGKCAHCMQQLQAISKEAASLEALKTDVVAISTDDLETTKLLKSNTEGISFSMPLLADPSLASFRAYRAFDDFENLPMHGTFLIDPRGGVRFQRIGPEPFLDVEFLKTELARMNALLKTP